MSDWEDERNVEGTEDRKRYFSVKENNDPGEIWNSSTYRNMKAERNKRAGASPLRARTGSLSLHPTVRRAPRAKASDKTRTGSKGSAWGERNLCFLDSAGEMTNYFTFVKTQAQLRRVSLQGVNRPQSTRLKADCQGAGSASGSPEGAAACSPWCPAGAGASRALWACCVGAALGRAACCPRTACSSACRSWGQ